MIARLRALLSPHSAMLSTSGAMTLTMLVNSGLGYLFWMAAARVLPAADVGTGSTLVAAMALLSLLGAVGFGSSLIAVIGTDPDRARGMTASACILAVIIPCVLAIGYVVAVSLASPDLRATLGNPLHLAIFLAGIGTWGLASVLDQVFIGRQRGDLLMGRNALSSGGKLVALFALVFLPVVSRDILVFASWAVGTIASLLAVLLVPAVRRLNLFARPDFGAWRDLGASLLGHHLLNIVSQVPGLLLPLVVTIILGVAASAAAYVSWMMAMVIFLVPASLATSVFSLGAGRPAEVGSRFRFSLKTSLAIGAAGTIGVGLFAGLVLRLFSAEYAERAADCLRLLTAGVFAEIVKYHFIAVARLSGGVGRGVVLIGIGAVLEVGSAAIGSHLFGLTGMAAGWLAGNCIQAVMLLPSVIAFMKRTKQMEPA